MCAERRGFSSWVWPWTLTQPAGTSSKGMWVHRSGGSPSMDSTAQMSSKPATRSSPLAVRS